MKIYLVGGAVRDQILGEPITERDFVVVGATITDMLAAGYKQVGKEFPVFLHPKTGEEYALARMERKIKPGYKGFTFDTSPHVTLEDDLKRRDLTINAMAKTSQGEIIDPYGGERDLADKILRHVSDAFVEDPVRILRVARFQARLARKGFTIAKETMALMQTMVNQGEVNALVSERVWKEWERALGEKNPEKFFEVLDACHALPILFPQIIIDGAGIKALKIANTLTEDRAIRLASLLHNLDPKEILDLSKRYRLPNAYKELALLTAKHHMKALQANQLPSDELLALLNHVDVFRRQDRFESFLITCAAIAAVKDVIFDQSFLREAAHVVNNIDIKSLLLEGLMGPDLAKAIQNKRKEKLMIWLKH